ncbi:MAG: hypothetical protein M3325_07970, partial [Actinomycetota bacterium]|nr:hypothetical protein [Actinomycetota bacterium]
MTSVDGLAGGGTGTFGSGVAATAPSTGTGLQAFRAGSRPNSSRVPVVMVTQSDRWLRAEVRMMIRSNKASVLSIRALVGSA